MFGCAAPDEDVEHSAVDEGDDAHDDDDSGPSGCAAETRDDTYALGLERTGEHYTVRFVDAMPSPPARFDNTWMLDIIDPVTGAPAENVELEVEPYMPDHNHGSSIECNVEKMAEPGRMKLEPVYLFMPGLWEVRLHLSAPEGTEDEVIFRFCVDS